MRFLQLEWHSHERARNAWDIERAEMKAKIAKQEGEVRYAKKVNDQLVKQIKVLEHALKAERIERKKTQNGARAGTPESKGTYDHLAGQSTTKGKSEHEGEGDSGVGPTKPANLPHNSFLDLQPLPELTEKERELFLDNTTKYFKSCMKEIQYLLTPPQQPPPPQMLPNGNYTGLSEAPLSIEDIYASAAARRQQQRQNLSAQVLPQPQSIPNHQPPPVPNSLPQTSGPESIGRGLRYSDFATGTSQPPNDSLAPHTGQQGSGIYDEQVESVTHTFDDRSHEQDINALTRQQKPADTDGWTFEEETQRDAQVTDPTPPPRRPDTDMFPSANAHLSATKSPPRHGSLSHRRKSSGSQAMSRRRSSQGKAEGNLGSDMGVANDPSQFKVKFALRSHLDVIRSVIFSGGGSPSEPEVCSAGDDGTIKRWIIPASYQNFNTTSNGPDLDIAPYFTHRGHEGVVTSLAAPPPSTGFSTGGRANGDGWVFSGGQDATIRVWERGRVDPKATLEGHTDAVWCVCVLPATSGVVFGNQSANFGGPDRLLLVSGSADGTVKVWTVSPPPQQQNASTGSRRGVGGSRRHSVTTGSEFPKSPQPSIASTTSFSHTLIHSIERAGQGDRKPSPTSICPLSPTGETFVVAYTDSSVLIFDTRTGEEVLGMASNETYDGSMDTSINTIVATSTGLEGAGSMIDATRGVDSEDVGAGATGSRDGFEGLVISGHEDRYVRFYDANSGQCTYTMLAHPAALSSLCLSKDGREAVSAGHDASIRFWSLEKRICTQDIVSHRAMRGEGVCCVCWSQDGRLVVSGGGDGVVKVFAR